MRYLHTQTSPLWLLPIAMTFGLVAVAQAAELEPIWMIYAIATLLVLISFAFKSLTVSDVGDALQVQFGPLPVFSKTIRYADITAVEQGRSSLLDGWGIHYVPLRGWTWNLWGLDCVVLHLGKKVLRIGTDDPENLTAFLQSAIQNRPRDVKDLA